MASRAGISIEDAGSPPASVTSPETASLRDWWMLLVIAILTVISLVDRNALNLLIDGVKQEFNVSDFAAGGLLGTSFVILYTFAGMPAGYLVDRFSRRNLIVVAVIFWSGMTVFSSLAATFSMLFIGRMGVGLGEAVLSPAGISLIRNVFPPSLRARAFAMTIVASSSGGGIALLLVGALSGVIPPGGAEVPLLGHMSAWRIVLMTIGAAGVPIGLLALTFKEPPRLAAGDVEGTSSLAFFRRCLVQGRHFYGPLFLGQALTGVGTYGYAAWMPVALARKWGSTPSEIGVTYGTIQILAAITGLMVGPALIDGLTKRYSPRMIMVVGTGAVLLIAISCILTPLMPNLPLSWAMVGLHWLAVPTSGVAAYTGLAAVTPGSTMGKISATSFICLSAAGYGLGPTLIPLAAEHWFAGPAAVAHGVSVVAGTALLLAAAALWIAGAYFRNGRTPVEVI